MDLSIITVSLNAKDNISHQLASIALGAKELSVEIFVVDNGSEDGTPDLIAKNFPKVNLIRNNANLGFSHANNQAAAISKGDFLLFLNPDMRLSEGSLDEIVNWIKNRPDVGIASCKLVDQQGKLNYSAKPRRFPGLLDQISILLKIPHLFPSLLNYYTYHNFNPDIEQEVDSVRGSFLLMRRSVYEKLGWAFDPRYFIWFEDVDVCRECKKLGFKVVYTPIISCVDYVGQTFNKMPALWKQLNFTKSMVKYFRKWEPWYKSIWISALRPLAIIIVFFLKK